MNVTRDSSIARRAQHSPWSATKTSRSLPKRKFYHPWPNDRASLPAPIPFRLPCLCHDRDHVRGLCRGNLLYRIHHGNYHDSRPFNCENKTTRHYTTVRRWDGQDNHTSPDAVPTAIVPECGRSWRPAIENAVGEHLPAIPNERQTKKKTRNKTQDGRLTRTQSIDPISRSRKSVRKEILLVMLRESSSSRAVHWYAR